MGAALVIVWPGTGIEGGQPSRTALELVTAARSGRRSTRTCPEWHLARRNLMTSSRTRASDDPLYVIANLLLGFRPKDKYWWEYLDQIWDAAETADRTSLTVLPALMLRAYKQSTPQNDATHK